MCVVDQTVCGVCEQERDGDDVQIAEGNLVVFLGLLLGFAELMLVLEDNDIWQEREPGVGGGRAQTDVHCLGDLPEFKKDAKSLTG